MSYSNLREHGFAGVNIDFEGLARTGSEISLVLLMQELQTKTPPGWDCCSHRAFPPMTRL